MGKNIKLSVKQFHFLYSYPAYAENRKQQQEQKLILLEKASAAYGDVYYNLKENTRKAVEMICWFGAEKGYCFAKEDYLSDRFDISPRTVRGIFKTLRDAGVICTAYRHSTKQNGLGAAVHFFAGHPNYETWKTAFALPECQAGCQAENAEIPCESKKEKTKKVSTKFLSFSKKLLKILRSKTCLDDSFTPKNETIIFSSSKKDFKNNTYSPPATFYQRFKNFIFSRIGEDQKLASELYRVYKGTVHPFTYAYEQQELEDMGYNALETAVIATETKKIRNLAGYFCGILNKKMDDMYYSWMDSVSSQGENEGVSAKYPQEQSAPEVDTDPDFLAAKAALEAELAARKYKQKRNE